MERGRGRGEGMGRELGGWDGRVGLTIVQTPKTACANGKVAAAPSTFLTIMNTL
jgi:hypothetical protein